MSHFQVLVLQTRCTLEKYQGIDFMALVSCNRAASSSYCCKHPFGIDVDIQYVTSLEVGLVFIVILESTACFIFLNESTKSESETSTFLRSKAVQRCYIDTVVLLVLNCTFLIFFVCCWSANFTKIF